RPQRQAPGAGRGGADLNVGPRSSSLLDDPSLIAGAAGAQAAGLMPQLFNRAAYNPAIVQLRFTEAKGRTTSADSDAFLDLTLIPAQGQIVGKRVEVSTSTFAGLLRQLYAQLSRQEDLRVANSASPARRLYDVLIGPLAAELETQKITTLLIGAERGLQGVPYAALHSGQSFVGERFAFALTPSLSLTNLTPAAPGENRLLAAGASQFDGLAPLPLVPQELDAIASTQLSDAVLNAAFTPATIEQTAADPRYSRIHLATHAEFLPGGASKSKLYSGTGPVSLVSLANLRKQRQGAPIDLIAFSACRTALGDADSELGFAGLALQAGARSAIGTLWYVDDVATSAYFIQAYRYLQQGIPKAEALQFTRRDFASGRVQLSGDQLLGGDGLVLLSGLTTAQQRRVSSGLGNPYFWAGIELLGAPW
ncbi:MAG: CHAT domain-containing protein, partial [Prochlorococcaceae cyanobacterium]